MSMEALPWYKTFFGEDYLQIYTFLTPERTEREVDGIVALLNLPTGSQYLICAAGTEDMLLPLPGVATTSPAWT